MDLRSTIAHELDHARRRTLDLCAAVADDDLLAQHSVLMSPLVWDLAHVGNYEDQWLLRALGAPGVRPDLDDIYDAFRHPRAGRPSLPLLPPDATRAYIADVRAAVLDHLERVDLDGPDRLARAGAVFGMVIQHEHQHAETMTATRQLMGERAAPLATATESVRPGAAGATARDLSEIEIAEDDVFVPGGTVVVGTDSEPWAYDNERPAHPVEIAPFRIDRVPVTNRAFAAFVADGGYRQPQWWDDDGLAFIRSESIEHPLFWRHEGGDSWSVLRFGRRIDLDPAEPVQHVCWHEATAYARWAGRRLPTEVEWECAATWDGEKSRRWPWGGGDPDPTTATLAGFTDGPRPVGSAPDSASAWGCQQMIGDVWEWTATSFDGYPGFSSFPYREYSEVFFGADYQVLRGGSWATHRQAVRPTFRNWDYPIRRHIFAGFRCARDA